MASGSGRERFVDLEAVDVDARETVEPRLQLVGREEQLFGCEHRPLDVVAAFLVTLGDARGRALDRRRQVGAGAYHRTLW